LNSDVNEAIEEGAVSTLIAMSLEGRIKNQASDEFIEPQLFPPKYTNIKPPSCVDSIYNEIDEALWYEVVVVTKGGAAGKGPEPPEPQAISVDGESEYSTNEEADAAEVEGKTKMAFAKQQVPQSLKESYLLTDSDFMVRTEDDPLPGDDHSEVTADDDSDVGEHRSGNLEDGGGSITPGLLSGSSPLPPLDSPAGSFSGAGRKSFSTAAGSSAPNSRSGKNRSGSPGTSPQQSSVKKKIKKDRGGGASAATTHVQHQQQDNAPSMSEQAAKLGLYA